MSGFTKLFSSLVYSTVWREEMHVKVVWITMLALADRNGRVLASIPGLADAARVTTDQCVEALKKLSSPDEWSRTKSCEGRRIEEVDGGWKLLNYLKYRELRADDERRIQTREAVRKYRERHVSDSDDSKQCKPLKATVSHCKPKQKQKQKQKQNEDQERRATRFETFWKIYPRKVGKGNAEKQFNRISVDDTLLTSMISALEWQIRMPQWTRDGGKFIPYPATWLNQKRWEDEPFNQQDSTDASWAEFESKVRGD